MSPFLEISDWSASITVNAPLSKTPILDMDEWTITVSFFSMPQSLRCLITVLVSIMFLVMYLLNIKFIFSIKI